MPKPKFKKGEFVFIRPDFVELAKASNTYHSSPGVVGSMIHLKGKRCKIVHVYDVDADGSNYYYEIQGCHWREEWLIPVNEDTLFEMYVNNQIDTNQYEEAKEVIASES